MNPRTTGILLTLALLLGAFIYFYEIRGEPGRKQAEEASKRVFPEIEADAIRRIRLHAEGGESVLVERRESGWRVLEPVDFPGDEVALDGMASTLAGLTSEGVVEAPQPLAVYGLDEERRVVRFWVGEGGEELGLRLGAKTPVGSNSYVSTLVSDKVYTVPTWRLNSLQHALVDIRDRRVLHFDSSMIDRVEVSWPSGGVALEKREEDWWLVEPVEGRADQDTLDNLLSDLSFLRAEGFQDQAPPDSETGLDRPEFRVHLAGSDDQGERLEFDFALGSIAEEGHRLARAAQPSLYRIREERLSDFPRELVAYRFKQISRFAASEARSFEIRFRDPGAEPMVIRGQRGEAGWETEPEPMAAGKAGNLISELSSLVGSDIVADSVGDEELAGLGLAPPRVALRVLGEAVEGEEPETLAEVHLGIADPDRGILARSVGQRAVYAIEHELGEHLPISYEAFQNRFVSAEIEEPEPGEESPAGEIPSEFSLDPTLSE
jgi:hypothetical protein